MFVRATLLATAWLAPVQDAPVQGVPVPAASVPTVTAPAAAVQGVRAEGGAPRTEPREIELEFSDPAGPQALAELRQKLTSTARRLQPNVVLISVECSANEMMSVSFDASGVVIDPKGRVVTFGGVLTAARRVSVRFPNSPSLRPRRARVLGVDAGTDVGVLDVGPIDLPGLEFTAAVAPAAGANEAGPEALAVAPPRDLSRRFVVMLSGGARPNAVTFGLRNEPVQNLRAGRRRYEQLVDITVARTPECAGGIVAEPGGCVVGLLLPPPSVLGATDPPTRGMLALPAQLLQQGVEQVLRMAPAEPAPPPGPVRAWLGLRGSDLTETEFLRQLGASGAVVVEELFEESPALAAGVEPHDLLLSWNGQPLSGMDDLTARLTAAQPDEKVALDVLRRLERVKVEFALGAW